MIRRLTKISGLTRICSSVRVSGRLGEGLREVVEGDFRMIWNCSYSLPSNNSRGHLVTFYRLALFTL
jgi:hypothetical protein